MTRLLLLAAMLSVAAPGLARATEPGTGVVVVGEATLQPQLIAKLEEWLRTHAQSVVPSPLPPDAINTLVDCFVLDDQGCARAVIDTRSKSDALVLAKIDVSNNEDGTRDVTITGYWFRKGGGAIVDQRTCESCNDDSLAKKADDLMRALAHTARIDGPAPAAPPKEPPRPTTSATTPAAATPTPSTSRSSAAVRRCS